MNMTSPIVKMGGRYKIEAFVPGNSKRLVADWFENLITNYGMNALAAPNGDLMQYCSVGTSNAQPAFTNTNLGSRKATVSGVNSPSATKGKNVAEGYTYKRKTWEFVQGSATGVLAEVGIGDKANGSGLFSRALIKDAQGNPTSITILPDEILQVTWEVRIYWPQTAVSGTINIQGSGMRNYSLLPCAVGDSSYWNLDSYNSIFAFNQTGSGETFQNMSALSPITSKPSGGDYYSATVNNNATHTPNTFFRILSASIGLPKGNYPNGIKGITFSIGSSNSFLYQVLFDQPIMKTDHQVLGFVIKVTWARA